MASTRNRRGFELGPEGTDSSIDLIPLLSISIGSGRVDLLEAPTGGLWLSAESGGGSVLSEMLERTSWCRLGDRLVGAGGRMPRRAVTIRTRQAEASFEAREGLWVLGASAPPPEFPIEFLDQAGRVVEQTTVGYMVP